MQNEVPFMKENRLLFTNALIVLPTETIKGPMQNAIRRSAAVKM